ncbi:DUF397 domain-containing protein [Streptomyces sp. NPDC001222]|uniref:DUF397 domain-containing protein n=1 Tax=Streptomyces sp. NPDC001222 TaxID=3364548 RepID=UPI00368EEC52
MGRGRFAGGRRVRPGQPWRTRGAAVRGSQSPDSPVLLFTEDEWRAFVRGVKAGEFD